MKSLIVILLFSSSVFAKGTLQFEPSYFFMSERMGYKGGIAIHEDLFGPFAYSSWTGLGTSPQTAEVRILWASSQHDLVVYFGDLTVSAGVGMNFGHEDLPESRRLIDYNTHLKLGYRIW